MRKAIEDYIRKCDLCQRRKGTREFVATLGEVQEPKAPFQLTAKDVTDPHRTTPRWNKTYPRSLTISQNMLKRFPLRIKRPKHAHEFTRLKFSRDTAQLITDQGPAFMSSFFQETCKVLGIRRIRTTSYRPASNGMLEKWHKALHTALSHYINAANTNWDTIASFFFDGA